MLIYKLNLHIKTLALPNFKIKVKKQNKNQNSLENQINIESSSMEL